MRVLELCKEKIIFSFNLRRARKEFQLNGISPLIYNNEDFQIKRMGEATINPIKGNSAIYARVSLEENRNLENQVKHLVDCANKIGDKNCVVYAEQASGFSLTRHKRPEFYRLVSDMKKKNIKRIYVVKRDRFHKDVPVMIRIMKNICGEHIEIVETGTDKMTV